MLRIFIFSFLLIIPYLGYTQVLAVGGDNLENCLENSYVNCKSHNCEEYITEMLKCIQKRGYFNVNYNRRELRDTIFIDVISGKPYNWGKLQFTGFPDSSRIVLAESIKTGKIFDKVIFDSLAENLIKEYNSRGYLNSAISLDSISMIGRSVQAQVKMELGEKTSISKFRFVGNTQFKSDWLLGYLDVSEDDFFNEELIIEKLEKLRTIGFFPKGAQLKTSDNGQIVLEIDILNPTPSSGDGLLGFVRDPLVNGYFLTGFLDLQLSNLFQRGINTRFEWNRLRPASQSIDLEYYHPYLFHPDISLELDFKLLKSDSTFLDRSFYFGGEFIMNNYALSLGSNLIRSRNLKAYSEIQETLDETGDYNLNYLKTGLKKKAGAITGYIEFNIGEKRTLRNAAFEERAYQNIDPRYMQYLIQSKIKGSFEVLSNWFIQPQLSGGFVNSSYLFINDYFRVGGLNTIRGFRENRFLAPGYLILNSNIVKPVSESLSWLLFYDLGILGNFHENFDNIFAQSFGSGINLKVAESMTLRLLLANGKTDDLGFNIENTIIHFGIRSDF